MTYKEEVIVDAVVHGYNREPENLRHDYVRESELAAAELANMQAPEEKYKRDPDDWFFKMTAEELERILFLESDLDFIIHHSLPLYGYYKDGYCSFEQGQKLRERNPDRVATFTDVDPHADDWEGELEKKADEGKIDGVKLYPSRHRSGSNYRLSLTEGTGHEILQKTAELGIESLAIHKAYPIGPEPYTHERIDDVAEVAPEFPDINFQIVHAGNAFMEETILALQRMPNVYANLEVTMNLMHLQPRRFAEILGRLLMWVGPQKLLFASGCNWCHPQHLIEDFWEFQIPKDLSEEYGYPQLTDDMKRQILGHNTLKLLGRDPEEVRSATSDDNWAQERSEMTEKPEPWSSVQVKS